MLKLKSHLFTPSAWVHRNQGLGLASAFERAQSSILRCRDPRRVPALSRPGRVQCRVPSSPYDVTGLRPHCRPLEQPARPGLLAHLDVVGRHAPSQLCTCAGGLEQCPLREETAAFCSWASAKRCPGYASVLGWVRASRGNTRAPQAAGEPGHRAPLHPRAGAGDDRRVPRGAAVLRGPPGCLRDGPVEVRVRQSLDRPGGPGGRLARLQPALLRLLPPQRRRLLACCVIRARPCFLRRRGPAASLSFGLSLRLPRSCLQDCHSAGHPQS
mmetsp:Transcript_80204/g.214846  ORF Transcript_80204/g.214846 Transcript_80204/m.214846 type:complete len:270 (+) Transcript_80204:1597-2406(+)